MARRGGRRSVARRYLDFTGAERYDDCYRNLLIEFRDIIREDRPAARQGRGVADRDLSAGRL